MPHLQLIASPTASTGEESQAWGLSSEVEGSGGGAGLLGSPRIELSRSFDAFLDWGRLGPVGFVSTATDDDSGGNTDPRLEVVIPADGTYVLRAHALERGQTGAYSIIVERRPK